MEQSSVSSLGNSIAKELRNLLPWPETGRENREANEKGEILVT